MSEKKEGLDLVLLDAVVANPGTTIINIIEQFSNKASKNTIRRYIGDLEKLGLITAKKETVLRPTTLGKVFREKNVGEAHPREDEPHV